MFFDGSRYVLHDTGFGYPESSERSHSIHNALIKFQWPGFENRPIKPKYAKTEDILRCHTPEYYDLVQNQAGRLPILSPYHQTSKFVAEVMISWIV
jgi:acetoin utilization deacetylase AcuC-like enzyme